MTRRTRDYQTLIWRIWYIVARNSIGTVYNMLLASATGRELHHLILSMIVIHGGCVKIDRYREIEIEGGREREREIERVGVE